MNSKLIILILIFICSSCGLKTRPKPPQGSTLPSVDNKYIKTYKKKSLNEEKEIKKKKEVLKK